MTPNKAELSRFFGPRANPAWLEVFVQLIEQLYRFYAFDRRRWRHFMAQIGAECNGLELVGMREDMTYTTASRIVQIYRYRLQLAIRKVTNGDEPEPAIARNSTVTALARKLVRQPKLLASIVYGGREGTPWMMGWKYIGRGPTQTTHYNGYAAAMAEIQRQPGGDACPDLLEHPEALEEPEWGIRAAFADWHIKGLNRYADQDSLELVSDALNTGDVKDKVLPHGMNNRRHWFSKATGAWPNEDLEAIADAGVGILKQGDEGPSVKRLQELLVEKGWFDRVDGIYGQRTEDAVVTFQRNYGLEPDGKAGPLTFETLEKAPRREDRQVDTEVLVKNGHEAATFTQWAKKQLRRVGKALGFYTADSATLGVTNTAATTAFKAAESAVSKAEGLKAFAGRVQKLLGGVPVELLVGGAVTIIVLVAVYVLVDRLEKRILKRAQQGANLKG